MDRIACDVCTARHELDRNPLRRHAVWRFPDGVAAWAGKDAPAKSILKRIFPGGY
jgi:hypothetical protein